MRDKRFQLDPEVALQVLEDLKELDCQTVNFSGGGEPTLHPDFGPLLVHARELGFRTWVVTHGGHINKWIPALLSADHVRVSLDAMTPKQHEAMHRAGPGAWNKVIENIGALTAARGTGRKPEIGISFLLSEQNTLGFNTTLQRLLWLAEDLGVDFLHIRPVSDEPVQPCSKVANALAYAENCLPSMRRRQPGPVVFPIAKRGGDVFHQREFAKCYAALTLAVVGANGDVQACCDRRDIVFGNVNTQRFKDIWLSAGHREKAAAIAPKLCTRCLMCSVNRGIEKYVVKDEALAGLL